MPVVVMGFPLVLTARRLLMMAVGGEVNAAVVDRSPTSYIHFVLSSPARGGFSGGPVLHAGDAWLGVVTESLQRKPERRARICRRPHRRAHLRPSGRDVHRATSESPHLPPVLRHLRCPRPTAARHVFEGLLTPPMSERPLTGGGTRSGTRTFSRPSALATPPPHRRLTRMAGRRTEARHMRLCAAVRRKLQLRTNSSRHLPHCVNSRQYAVGLEASAVVGAFRRVRARLDPGSDVLGREDDSVLALGSVQFRCAAGGSSAEIPAQMSSSSLALAIPWLKLAIPWLKTRCRNPR